MKRCTFVFLLAAALSACSATPGKIKQQTPVTAVNNIDSLALHGYDAVAYFEVNKPTLGAEKYSYTWQGITWRFVSERHRSLFAARPERYAPQFGGYCAFALSRGYVVDIDPDQWAIVDGKLYLNNNSFAQSIWDKDRPGNIAAGNTNWPLVPKLQIAESLGESTSVEPDP